MRLAVLLVLMAAAPPACAARCPSHVAQGEAYSTGNATFDDFFAAVREVRGQAQAARSTTRTARTPA